jgi:hypothetical protein
VADLITQDWLDEKIIPKIARLYPNDHKLREIFGLTLLYQVYKDAQGVGDDPEYSAWIPRGALDNRAQAYADLIDQHDARTSNGKLPPPAVKVPIVVYAVEDRLCIRKAQVAAAHAAAGSLTVGTLGGTVAVTQDEEVSPAPSRVPVNGVAPRMTAGLLGIDATNRELTELKNEVAHFKLTVTQNQSQVMSAFGSLRNEMRTLFQQNNTNIRQFAGTIPGAVARQANVPLRRQVQADLMAAQAQNVTQGSASMVSKPRTLQEVYNEFEFGIGGRKPAKDFTTAERNSRVGGVKQKWYRRRIIYWMIVQLTNRNYMVQAACFKIREAFGMDWSVTQIINKALYHKAHGNWPTPLACLNRQS